MSILRSLYHRFTACISRCHSSTQSNFTLLSRHRSDSESISNSEFISRHSHFHDSSPTLHSPALLHSLAVLLPLLHSNYLSARERYQFITLVSKSILLSIPRSAFDSIKYSTPINVLYWTQPTHQYSTNGTTQYKYHSKLQFHRARDTGITANDSCPESLFSMDLLLCRHIVLRLSSYEILFPAFNLPSLLKASITHVIVSHIPRYLNREASLHLGFVSLLADLLLPKIERETKELISHDDAGRTARDRDRYPALRCIDIQGTKEYFSVPELSQYIMSTSMNTDGDSNTDTDSKSESMMNPQHSIRFPHFERLSIGLHGTPLVPNCTHKYLSRCTNNPFIDELSMIHCSLYEGTPEFIRLFSIHRFIQRFNLIECHDQFTDSVQQKEVELYRLSHHTKTLTQIQPAAQYGLQCQYIWIGLYLNMSLKRFHLSGLIHTPGTLINRTFVFVCMIAFFGIQLDSTEWIANLRGQNGGSKGRVQLKAGHGIGIRSGRRFEFASDLPDFLNELECQTLERIGLRIYRYRGESWLRQLEEDDVRHYWIRQMIENDSEADRSSVAAADRKPSGNEYTVWIIQS